MRVVRDVKLAFSGALTQAYDLESMGAKGLHILMSRDLGSEFELRGVAGDDAEIVTYLHTFVAGQLALTEYLQCGFPTPVSTLTFIWTGASNREGRLVFVDEPFAPYGRVIWRKGTDAIAAAATANKWTSETMGIYRTIKVIASSDRPCHFALTTIYRDISVIQDPVLTIAGVAGGFALSADIPGASGSSMSIINDDAVNICTVRWLVMGFL